MFGASHASDDVRLEEDRRCMGHVASVALLAAVWVAIHAIHSVLARRLPSSTTVTLSALSLHLSTTSLNSWPKRILSLSTRSRRKEDEDGEGKATLGWDVGALTVVAGIIVAQVVLVWAAVGAVRTIWSVGIAGSGSEEVVRRVKRAAVAVVAAGRAHPSSMVLRPVVSSY